MLARAHALFAALLLGLMLLTTTACGPVIAYPAGIPAEKSEGFLFYARTVANRDGYRTTDLNNRLKIEVPPHGDVSYGVSLDDGVIVFLAPNEGADDMATSSNEAALREFSNGLIERARAEATGNQSF